MNNVINRSLDAEVIFYQNNSIVVDNLDSTVSFDEQVKFHGTVTRDPDGNVYIIPFGRGTSSRDTSEELLVKTPFAKVRKSPAGKNVKMIISLPEELATIRNFQIYFRKITQAYKEYMEKEVRG